MLGKGVVVRQMTFETVGMLPKSEGRWNVRLGGGHIVFVNEDPNVEPLILVRGEGQVRKVVDYATTPGVELLQPVPEDAQA